MEQQERLEISGHFINSLINSKPGKKLNLAQMQKDANEAFLSEQRGRDVESRNEKVFREAEVQTEPADHDHSSPSKPTLINDLAYGVMLRQHEPEQTRLSHVLSISGQIKSPIAALASFIDNSVQAFHSQIVD